MPEKSGIDSVTCVGCCVNTADEHRAAAALVAMINVRMIDVSRKGR